MLRALTPKDPRTVGRFRVLARIAVGGTATVYLGLSVGGRAVAIKLLHRHLAHDRDARARFRREVAGLGRFHGYATVSLIDADTEAPVPWLATEFLPSVSLAEAVRDSGPLPLDAVLTLAADLVEALSSLHSAQIVHLDLNPANILLTADGPRVIDLGISEALTDDGLVASRTNPGTLGFAAPEQEEGGRVGPATDVYALAATLAYAATAEVPRADPQWRERLRDSPLGPILDLCLGADSADRPTVPQLAARLESAFRHDRPTHPPALPATVLAEIDQRAHEVLDPPLPEVLTGGHSRRSWLIGGVLALGVLALPAGDTRQAPRREPRAVRAVAKSPRKPDLKPRILEFKVTGNTSLTMAKYTINGEPTVKKDLDLPWETAVEIPPTPGETDWRFECRFPPGEINFRSVVDGYPTSTGTAGSSGSSGSTKFDGTV